uniref:Transposase MuDR plant domain-containing protein n=1 Tax=Chenopodium quinoa TaxID=63459 RepID=A0A803MUX2_CHEQI
MHLKPCIIVHHGGEWDQDEGQLIYNGGRVNTFDDIPEDVDSVYVKQVIDSLGYKDIVKVHFLDPKKDFQCSIRFLGFENSSCDPFLSLLLEFRVIEVYTEHEHAHVPSHIGIGVGGHGSFVELLNSGVPRSTDPFIDYNTEGSDEDDAEIVNARTRLNEEKQKEKSYEDELVMLRKLAESKGTDPSRYACDSDGLSGTDNPYESSDKDDYGYLVQPVGNKKNTVKGGSEGSASKFFVGHSFENSVTFKKVVTDYCIQTGRDIHFSRNDKNRVGGHCKSKDKGCPWRIWASWERGKRNFMDKTHVGEHTCGKEPTSKRVTTSWVARFFQSKFKVNPYMKVHDIIETVWLEKGLKVSRYLAFIARKLGQKLIIGPSKEEKN